MSENPLLSMAQRWFAAFNEHNLGNLLALYSENAQHYSPKLKLRSPETGGMITGKAELRLWWQESFKRLPSLKYVPTWFIADNSSVFMEYDRFVDGEPVLKVGEVLEIQDGLIVSSRVYHG